MVGDAHGAKIAQLEAQCELYRNKIDVLEKEKEKEQRHTKALAKAIETSNGEENLRVLANPKGRSRKFHELTMFLYLIYKLRCLHLDGSLASFASRRPTEELAMYSALASTLVAMDKENARLVTRQYEKDGSILVDETPRGRASTNYVLQDARKLKPQHLARIESYIAKCHGAKGSGRVTAKTRLEASLRLDNVTRSVVRYALVHMLGYRWGKVRVKKLKSDPERPTVVRTYLKAYADALALERRGTHKVVYLDESYVHQNHAPQYSWLKKDSDGRVERSSSKGKRVIILHAITNDGPLGAIDTNMEWKGDTPHPSEGPQSTCECLWVSASNSGDYHDNMNSNMFMLWVKNRLVPSFKATYPSKKMIIVMDNAPYHHARGVPSLSSLTTKNQILDAIKSYTPNLEWLRLEKKQGTRSTARVVSINDNLLQRASTKRPNVPTTEELKEAWLAALKGSHDYASLLTCKIETYLQDQLGLVDKTQPLGQTDAHTSNPLRLIGFLWTPPYTPTLQPIEEFWAGGKNYCASRYVNGRKVKQCIEQLRTGWYGDGTPDKPPLSCAKLVQRAMLDADRRLTEVGGLEGSMATGVAIVTGDKRAVILPPERMATDMTHKHIEAVDLTKDDEEETTPLELTEEDHMAAQLTALAEGEAVVEGRGIDQGQI